MIERTDQQWINQLKQEDEAAITDLWKMLFQFAVSAARKYQQSNDIGRDAAAAAYHRIRERGVYQYRFACPFLGYCRQIVVRELLRRIPKNEPFLLDIENVYSTAVSQRDPLPQAAVEMVQTRLEPCLERLNGREREIIDLLYFQEMTPEEAAESLHLTRNNTNVIAYRARRKLLDCLQSHGFETSEEVLRL